MKNKVALLTLLLVALCVSWTPADSIAANPGFDDKEIRVAQFGPQTGPAAPWGAVARGAAPHIVAMCPVYGSASPGLAPRPSLAANGGGALESAALEHVQRGRARTASS